MTAGSHYRTRYRQSLTPRQAEILALIAEGCTNGEIATRLGMTLDGAKWHVSEILAKLGVQSREEAVEHWRAERSVRGRLWRGLSVVHWGVALRSAAGAGALVAAASTVLAVWVLRGDHNGTGPEIADSTLVAESSSQPSPAATAASTATVTASSTAATFLFSPTTLDSPLQKPGDLSWAEQIRSIRAFVGAVECDRVSLVDPVARDAGGNAPLVVGLPEQPAPCRVAGATVTFVMSRGWVMFVEGTLEPGSSRTFQNLAPLPPGSPMYPAEETILLFPLPNFLGSSGKADPKDITVFADGERCMRVAVADGGKVSPGYIAVPLGRPGQPPACSRTGANVLGYDQDGNQLLAQNYMHALEPLTWMYLSGEVDPDAPKRDPSELGPVDTAWP